MSTIATSGAVWGVLLLLLLLTYSAAFGAFFVFVLWLMNKAKRAHEREMTEGCTARGWTYSPLVTKEFIEWPAFQHLFSGINFTIHGVKDQITGQASGLPFTTCFYDTGVSIQKANSRQDIRYTIVVVPSPVKLRAPLVARPDSAFWRTLNHLKNSDQHFESQTFNDAYRVACEDPRLASDLMNPLMMETILRHPDITYAFHGESVILVCPEATTFDALEANIAIADRVSKRVPGHLASL